MTEPSSLSPASSIVTPAAADDAVSAAVPGPADERESNPPVTQSLSSLQKDLADACHEVTRLRESNDKLKDQLLQATRRENILILRLASKDKALMELKEASDRSKKSSSSNPALPSETMLQKALVDPAVNLVFERMRKEVEEARLKVTEMESELSAWKFTPDSTTGKRLMAKCRLLYQENEELGRMISSGKVAKLEGEVALQKNFQEEIKKSQSEIDDFLIELDEDFEGMQTTIVGLQTQLTDVKNQLLSFQTNMFKQNGNSNGNHAEGTNATDAGGEGKETSPNSGTDDAPTATNATATAPAAAGIGESADVSPVSVSNLPDDQSNGSAVKRVLNEDSTLDSSASKRTKSEVDEQDSDALISCSMDSSSFIDSSEAAAAP